ncbi:MAG: DNA methyltransferase [Pseudomonadota bacterium]
MQWFYETALLLRELLAEDGSIYVHLDWHVAHYAKAILDEVFGYDNFLNEVVWFYKTGGASKDRWARKHDNIFFYTKKEGTQRFNLQTEKSYMMPERLLERIIKASSNKGDLVLDCFCGSGTTPAVAEKLERRWIACDLGRFAIHTTRKRLLSNPDVKPFIVQNLGKYERQHWMSSEFTNPQDRITQEKSYRQFILNLYHADKIDGYTWLHGVKKGRMVHIGSVDAPVALGDVKNIVQELWKKGGNNGLDILGREFAFELNETARQFAAANKVDLKFKKIPREVLDKRAVDQGDISFFELAALDVSAKVNKKHQRLTLTLNNFIVLPDDVPKDVMQAITHWSQWIDYWAVDFNYHDDTFHNEWQSYRTKKKPEIDLSVAHYYQEKGTYTVVVKVIDILGNDTTKLLEIKI